MAVDVEVIEFRIPTGSSGLLRLNHVSAPPHIPRSQIYQTLHSHFSQYGLLNRLQLHENEDEEEEKRYYSYIQYYSARAASKARVANRGGPGSRNMVRIEHGVQFKVGHHVSAQDLPSEYSLSRAKCEELANYYLGFNGWSSSVQYHRQEEAEQGTVKVVSIAKLEFPRAGLSCEGAGMATAEIGEGEGRGKVMAEVGKRARGEAMQSAWARVVLVVVGGNKVQVEINTTKMDQFYYEPLWDEPAITVMEADYKNWTEEEL